MKHREFSGFNIIIKKYLGSQIWSGILTKEVRDTLIDVDIELRKKTQCRNARKIFIDATQTI